jgi:hypothetical protein
VGQYGSKQLEAIAIEQGYFIAEEFQHSGMGTQIFFDVYFQGYRLHSRENLDYTRVLDLEDGLRLYSVTLSELINWDFTFRVSAVSDDDETYVEIIERLKAMTRTLAAYFGQEQVEVRLFPCFDERISWIYHRQTDSFEIER